MNRFKGKKVLVTGAGKGIGRGVAKAFAEEGADLLIHFRSNPQEAESLREELKTSGGTITVCQADLATDQGLTQLFDTVKHGLGGLDVAVNNAGWDPGYVELATIDAEMYRRLTDINIRGTFFCCLREIALMRQAGKGGSIINIGSVQMETTVPGRALYAMSKGAIHSLTGELALEVGPEGIRVNCIAPGYIEVARMCEQPGFNRTEIAAGIPLRRLGIPQDVGACAVFLASEDAGFISGQSIIVDGGVSRKLARSAP